PPRAPAGHRRPPASAAHGPLEGRHARLLRRGPGHQLRGGALPLLLPPGARAPGALLPRLPHPPARGPDRDRHAPGRARRARPRRLPDRLGGLGGEAALPLTSGRGQRYILRVALPIVATAALRGITRCMKKATARLSDPGTMLGPRPRAARAWAATGRA